RYARSLARPRGRSRNCPGSARAWPLRCWRRWHPGGPTATTPAGGRGAARRAGGREVSTRQGGEAAMASPPAHVAMLTGRSGAGKSTTAKSLEDLDWYVIENLPPGLLPTMVDLAMRASGPLPRIAAVIDLRSSRAISTELGSSIRELATRGIRPRVVFLE